MVRDGARYLGLDTAAFLAAALGAVAGLEPRPDYVAVTGDLVNFGTAAEYANFARIMAACPVPYHAIVGNHDDRERFRTHLPPAVFGAARAERVRFAIDAAPLRFVGLDFCARKPWPGAIVDDASLEWLEETLAARPAHATIVAVHQPPFRSGLHYLDAGGFIGAARLRAIVDRHAQVRAVISGHVHCVRRIGWRTALASTAPSTAPQPVPLLFTQGKIAAISHEAPGFVLHDLHDDGTYERTVLRGSANGDYAIADRERVPA